MPTAAAPRRHSLVIVESPAKAKTIAKILGNDYMVAACYGHVRDLPNSKAEMPKELRQLSWAKLGIDVANDFRMHYVVSEQKRPHVDALRKALAGADALYLATDGDREGEAIAWHLVEVLEPTVPVYRLVFHEITRKAIETAMRNTRTIDTALVDAQEARRAVDRLVGYEVSPLLWRKIAPKLSAGRVQSVGLRLLVEREQERMAFRSGQWWDLAGMFVAPDRENAQFSATLTSVGGVRLADGSDFDPATGRLAGTDRLLLDDDAAAALRDRLGHESFTVSAREDRPYTASPKAPFTTSSLQQEAARKLGGFTANRTMQVAQQLYERGVITYMRTDSTNLAEEAVVGIRAAVERLYGADHVPPSPRHYRTKVANAQEAHEAIRPAGTDMPSPESLRAELSDDEFRLYDLIWKRTVSSQMVDARGHSTTLKLTSTTTTGPAAEFSVSGRVIDFTGFRRAYVEGSDEPEADRTATDTTLPAVAVGDRLACRSLEARSHDTQPPARYTEASLTKKLEQLSIGRPSTYAKTIETLLDKEYCRKRGTALIPTWVAFGIAQFMSSHLPHLVDYEFTARLEEQLDAVSHGMQNRLDVLKRFYCGNGSPGLEGVLRGLATCIDPTQASSVTLPCGLTVRTGKYRPYVPFNGKNVSLPPVDVLAPDQLTVEAINALAAGDQPLGQCPTTGKPVFKKTGRDFSTYVQLGQNDDAAKKTCSLLKGMFPEAIDLAMALRLLDLPRMLGAHPETGLPVQALNGKHGPYIKCGDETRSLTDGLSPLEVTLTRAIELLAKPKPVGRGSRDTSTTLRTLGVSPVTGKPVEVKRGRFGTFVTDGKTNATLPKDISADEITFDHALELIAARPKKRGRR